MTPIRVAAVGGSLVLRGIASLLQGHRDFSVAGEIGGGKDVLDAIRRIAPEVVLAGIGLGGIPAGELVECLHEHGLGVRVVVLAATAGEQDCQDLLARGVAGIVAVQDEPEAVFAALHSAAAGNELWLSPQIAVRLLPRKEKTVQTAGLTSREREVLLSLALGKRDDEIAGLLHIARGTVRNVLSSIYGKLGVHTRAEAVAWAWQHRLVQADAGHRDGYHRRP